MSAPTLIHMSDGSSVRASETMQEVFERVESLDYAWTPITDPSDEREKLIRSASILWFEEEREAKP